MTRPVPAKVPAKATVQSAAPHKRELFFLRWLIVAALVLLYIFIKWFFRDRNIGYYPLYALLCISLGYKLVKLLFEWYHYWSVSIPRQRVLNKAFTVDMLTTAMPGEPYDMIENTLRAMVNVRYPHTTYLCDEGNDPALKKLCAELGVIHTTRQLKINAKAGNINNALQNATGDICVVLDPDHAPLPQFLDEVLPYFDNPAIGFVQVAQVYKNAGDTWIARGAAQQTYVFYGPLMMGMNSYGTAQAIGANCTFRREALDSIGGHAAGLSEDMHTAMRLHAHGWKSVYLPRIVTRGLVPANIDAYYKQQLKWSRGTFELLLAVFPLLFTRFSWRQRLHYFLLPFHFAAGIIALIDICIPVMALFSGETPLYFNTTGVFWLLIPLLCLILCIRQYAQRWLLEKHERGFHLAGGMLLFGTGWIYTLGLLYTLLRINVPYIPTPKEDDKSNNLALHIPNIIVCLLCITAVVYGLDHDWNPYNFVMAGFALLIVFMLGAVILASQQLFLQSLKNGVKKWPVFYAAMGALRKTKGYITWGIYTGFRKGAPLLATATLAGSVLFFTLAVNTDPTTSALHETRTVKNPGGFYTGVYIPQVQHTHSLESITAFQQATQSRPAIVSLYEAWGPASLDNFPASLLNRIADKGSIPMITWEPWVGSFAAQKDWPVLPREKKGLAAIAAGALDDYIQAYAAKIKDFDKPVFIRFAHEADNPAYPWSAAGGNTADDYKAAWNRVVRLFAAAGVTNVSWVWTPWSTAGIEKYYPGDDCVDWIGVTCLNYGAASWDGHWRSFEAIYNPYRKALLALNKPVMLAEFGSTNYGGQAGEWLLHALHAIRTHYTEIKSCIFFNSREDKNWITAWRPRGSTGYIDWTIQNPGQLAAGLAAFNPAPLPIADAARPAPPAENVVSATPSLLKGHPGAFTLTVNDNPFYIKGIAYNPGQDWRDGNHPLTIKQLQQDFAAIKETGCNTIRRYQPSIYDRNILKTAKAYDLKVLYGFWFDPRVDYYRDSAQVKKYLRLVEEKVKQYQQAPAILAWCPGDQTGDALSNDYAQPYIGLVRTAYLQMIERMAQSIHRIDPSRPVITALGASRLLPSDLQACRRWAPSVDIIGINAYYEQALDSVPSLMHAYDSTRPYLLSAFGPKGYWDTRYTNNTHLPEEDNDGQKAALYARAWNEGIQPNKGYNLGGVAFCWQDRFSGSATWFGITDFRGRRKAAFYALQKAWTHVEAGTARRSFGEDGYRLFLVGPAYPLAPGEPYEFTAVYNDSSFKKIEWHLYREDYINEISFTPSNKANKVWIKLPSRNGQYRLYAYLYDEKGNVVTASMPVVPYEGNYREGGL